MAQATLIPPPSVPVDPVDGAYRLRADANGAFLQVKNADTGKYHSLFAQGAAGVETLALGPAED